MKIKVLVDNNTFIDEYYFGEPALSFYLEEENNKILFDTGYSDIFLKNAKLLNIDLTKIDYLILSHGHNDHTGGLQYLKEFDLSNTKLLCHPAVFEKRNYNGLDVGTPTTKEELNIKEYIDGTNFYQITNNLFFLGQIKRKTTFEGKPVGYKTMSQTPDYLLDDSALVYKSKKGLFIITACSHAGICNIILQAKAKLQEEKILGIIGGLHLLEENEQLFQTIDFLKKENIELLYPCHCVSLKAKHLLYQVGQIREVGTGLSIEIE